MIKAQKIQTAKKIKSPPKTLETKWVELIRTSQGRRLPSSEIPQLIREEMEAYRPVLEDAGFHLLSADSHPLLLTQGQFMFWPTDQQPPSSLPPESKGYVPVMKGRPIGIDLFAGAGGLSLGFEQAGFDIAACVEIDPVHCATHEYNFPYSASICGSVTDLSGQEIRHRAGIGDQDVDVVFGGAPCQGFSLIGKRALDDPRNQLVFHYVRLVRELNPKFCVFENVKGLTVGGHVQFLKELISTLEDAGYRVTLPYKVLNAADYGVPQNRHRLFLLACRHDQKAAAYPPSKTTHTTVEEAISDLPDADQFDSLLSRDSVQTRRKATPRRSGVAELYRQPSRKPLRRLEICRRPADTQNRRNMQTLHARTCFRNISRRSSPIR